MSGGQCLQEAAGYGADPDDLYLPVGVGAVHHTEGGGHDELGCGLGLYPDLVCDDVARQGAAPSQQFVYNIG